MRNKYDAEIPDKFMTGWDNLYKKLTEQPLDKLEPHFVHYAPLEFSFFVHNEEKEGKTAIDLGTGDGIDACYLAQLGYSVTAIDALPSAVEITKKRAKALGIEEKVDVLLKNILKFEVEPESYDVVCAVQTLQYLQDKAESKMYELIAGVKPGGWFLFGGNVKPHFPTEGMEMRFITIEELRTALKGWEIYSLAWEERLVRPNDRRGYVWAVAQKPQEE